MMDNSDKPPRASWLRPRLRRYMIKERPKSWAHGNYRKLALYTDDTPIPAHRQSMPPAPPVRSPLTRLQTVPSFPYMEPQTASNSPESKKPEVDHKTTETVYYEDSEMDKIGSNSKSWIEDSPEQAKQVPVLI